MLHFLCDVLLICLLVQVSLCDIREMRIPDRLNLGILLLGLGRQAVSTLCWPGAVLGGLLAAALPMYLVAVAFPGSLGGGDIKLAAAAGVYLGAGGVLRGTGAGVVAAGIYAAVCLLLHKKTARQTFPLGPFLAAGYMYQIICSS